MISVIKIAPKSGFSRKSEYYCLQNGIFLSFCTFKRVKELLTMIKAETSTYQVLLRLIDFSFLLSFCFFLLSCCFSIVFFLFSQIGRFFRFLLLKLPLSVLVYLVVSFSHWFWDGGGNILPEFLMNFPVFSLFFQLSSALNKNMFDDVLISVF